MTFEGKLYAAMAVAAVGACLVVLMNHRCGVEVTVVNRDRFTVRGAEVLTTAGAYPLGDIAPGASASTLVGAAGESSVELTWIDQGGTARGTTANVYFEGSAEGSGYGGAVEFSFADDAVVSHADVRPVLGLLSRGTPPPADPRRRSR